MLPCYRPPNFEFAGLASAASEVGGAPAGHSSSRQPAAGSHERLDEDEERDQLRAVRELPVCFQQLFSFRYFNAVQSQVFQWVYGSDNNTVVSAPTGGGKTCILEMAMLRLLLRHVDPSSGEYMHRPGALKIVYLAPIRALVQERVRDWRNRFGKLGLKVFELSGDNEDRNPSALDSADIICSTPESFDSLSRRHKDNGGMRFIAEVGLLLIDEVHLLADQRGACLEAGVVSRVKLISHFREMQESPIAHVRYLAVSATVPNIQDIGRWLEVPPGGVHTFGEEYRPCKLVTHVRGYHPTKADFLFDKRLNDHIYGIIAEFSKGRPTLVFCTSRKGASDTAAHLVAEAARRAPAGAQAGAFVQDQPHWARLQAAADAVAANKALAAVLRSGVGFHHAGMEGSERLCVEELFLSHDLPVLCTTSTLALGVNLPCFLCVIKGTRRWGDSAGGGGTANDGGAGYREYERSVCLQMIGRAGRPQFDTEGVAVIMTQKQDVPRYRNLLGGSEDVGSCLAAVLPEYLNAEISLRTVKDVPRAIEWLQSTFMYLRVLRSPGSYGAPPGCHSVAELKAWMREKFVLATIRELAQHGLLETDADGYTLSPLPPGDIMAHHYIRFKTMLAIAATPTHASMPDLLHLLARSEELSDIRLRRTEKKVLNAINTAKGGPQGGPQVVRFHVVDPAKGYKVKERIVSAAEKIFILVNEALSDSPSGTLDYSMRQELDTVLRQGQRIVTAMAKYFAHQGNLAGTANALLLRKCLRQRLWDNSLHQCRQLPQVGPAMSARLVDAGITSLRKLAATDPRTIERITGRKYPLGNAVLQQLRNMLPPLVELQLCPLRRLPGGRIECEVTLTRCEDEGSSSHGMQLAPPRGNSSHGVLVVGSLHDDALLVHEELVAERFPSPYTHRVVTRGPPPQGAELQLVASLIYDRYLGFDVMHQLSIPSGQRLNQPAPQQISAQEPPAEEVEQAGSEYGKAWEDQAAEEPGSQAGHQPHHTDVVAGGRGGAATKVPPQQSLRPVLVNVQERQWQATQLRGQPAKEPRAGCYVQRAALQTDAATAAPCVTPPSFPAHLVSKWSNSNAAAAAPLAKHTMPSTSDCMGQGPGSSSGPRCNDQPAHGSAADAAATNPWAARTTAGASMSRSPPCSVLLPTPRRLPQPLLRSSGGNLPTPSPPLPAPPQAPTTNATIPSSSGFASGVALVRRKMQRQTEATAASAPSPAPRAPPAQRYQGDATALLMQLSCPGGSLHKSVLQVEEEEELADGGGEAARHVQRDKAASGADGSCSAQAGGCATDAAARQWQRPPPFAHKRKVPPGSPIGAVPAPVARCLQPGASHSLGSVLPTAPAATMAATAAADRSNDWHDVFDFL